MSLDFGEVYGSVLRSALFIEIARYVAQTREISQDDFQAVDKMSHLAAMFGLNVPYRMTMSQLKNMRNCEPALVTLAIQVQSILRFYYEADKCWKDLTRIKLKNTKWDERTVFEVHNLLEQNAKTYHLGKDNIPQGRYFNSNDINVAAFKAKAYELRVGRCAFFPDVDSLYKTSIPKRSMLSQNNKVSNLLGGKIPVLEMSNYMLSTMLGEPNICVAF